MSGSPGFAEFVVHGLDILYGVACACFVAVALWAVAAELYGRWRVHAPLTGPCTPHPKGDRP